MAAVALQVWSCPQFGSPKSLVRFLGPVRGIITHWGKGRPLACPGKERCPNHGNRPRWKGYAAGQWWDRDKHLWIPAAVEVTIGLLECLGTADVRGQGWQVYRVRRSYGSRAIEGTHVHDYDHGLLPRDFSVISTVQNLFGSEDVEWDVDPGFWLRTTAETSSDAPPMLPVEPPARVDKFGTPIVSADEIEAGRQKTFNRNGTQKKQPAK